MTVPSYRPSSWTAGEQRVPRRLGPGVGHRRAQHLRCAARAAAVLVGLAIHAATGINWVDPVIALGLAAWAVREGTEAWRGKDCC